MAGIPEIRQQMEVEVNRVLDEVWNTEAILNSINSYESLIIEHAGYYFDHSDYPHIVEESTEPIDIETEQDYRDVMAELRLFVREQLEMVLADLEPMFELAKEPRVYEQPAEEQGFFANLPWGKLMLMNENFASGSGWLGKLVSRVRHDMEGFGTGGETKALPTDRLIAMLLIWDDTPNLIIIALAYILLNMMKGFRRKY